MKTETLYIGTRSEIEVMCTNNHTYISEDTRIKTQLDDIEDNGGFGVVMMKRRENEVIDEWYVQVIDDED